MSSSIKPVLGNQLELGHPLATGLVGLWLMNEGSGNKVFDLSGNGNTGTFGAGAASPSWTSGDNGHALNFDGGDNVAVGNRPSLANLNEMTVICSMAHTAGSNDGIVSDWPGATQRWLLWISTVATKIGFIVREGGANKEARLTNDYNDGLYHQYAGVFNGTNVSIDVDGGKEIVVGDAVTAMDVETSSVRIGIYATEHMTGQIQYVYIYNRALSASEIALLYREPFIMFERDPIELWVGSVGVVSGTILPQITSAYMRI